MGCCLIDHDLMKILLRSFTSDIFTNNKMMITLGFSWLQLFFSFSVVSFIFVKKKQQQKTNLCVQFQFPSMTSLIFFQLCRFYFDIVSVILLLSDWQHIRLGRRSSLPKTTRNLWYWGKGSPLCNTHLQQLKTNQILLPVVLGSPQLSWNTAHVKQQ